MAEASAAARADARVAASPQPRLVVDDDAVCVEASVSACRLLGLARSEVVGRSVSELLEAGSREPFDRAWGLCSRRGGPAGRFSFDGPAAVELSLTITAEVLPGRHLIALDPADEAVAEESGAPAGAPAASSFGAVRPPTPRERQILGLLAAGATDPQIASALSLSPATVQTHVRNAKSKLGARTRTQAVALALRHDLIDAG